MSREYRAIILHVLWFCPRWRLSVLSRVWATGSGSPCPVPGVMRPSQWVAGSAWREYSVEERPARSIWRKDEVLDEVVALKVLAPALASQPEFRARFRAESITLANLSHPNVVRVHDYFEDEAGAYLVMDRVDGPSLCQLLAAYGRPFRSRVRA
jgi:serine/threonine protein kinase